MWTQGPIGLIVPVVQPHRKCIERGSIDNILDHRKLEIREEPRHAFVQDDLVHGTYG